MKGFSIEINTSKGLARLAQAQDLASKPFGGAFREADHLMREDLLDLMGENLEKQGALFGEPWAPPGPITRLFHEKPGPGEPVQTLAELQAKNIPAGLDTGELKNLLRQGGSEVGMTSSGNALTLRVPEPAGRFHFGGEATLASEKRQGSAPSLAGRLSRHIQRRTADGKHNPEFFRLYHWLKRALGRTFAVPPRPLLPKGPMPLQVKERLTRNWAKRWRSTFRESTP